MQTPSTMPPAESAAVFARVTPMDGLALPGMQATACPAAIAGLEGSMAVAMQPIRRP